MTFNEWLESELPGNAIAKAAFDNLVDVLQEMTTATDAKESGPSSHES